jgi:hypothetical protein
MNKMSRLASAERVNISRRYRREPAYPAFLWLAYDVKYSALNKSQSCKLVAAADPKTHREYRNFKPSEAFTTKACAHFAAVGEQSGGWVIWSKFALDVPTYPIAEKL